MHLKLTFSMMMFLFVFSIFAQPKVEGIGFDQTVEYLNKKLGSDFKVELANKNRQLVISYFKGGNIYKIDKVYLETLDSTKVSFSDEEKALIVRCKNPNELEGKMKKFRDGCVEREIMDKNTIGAYGRMNLEIGTDKRKIKALQNAIVHLIKLGHDPQYISNVPFE
jgi:hypothetical protein